jgi:hypothetical protein
MALCHQFLGEKGYHALRSAIETGRNTFDEGRYLRDSHG